MSARCLVVTERSQRSARTANPGLEMPDVETLMQAETMVATIDATLTTN